jgi:hypothetical protein
MGRALTPLTRSPSKTRFPDIEAHVLFGRRNGRTDSLSRGSPGACVPLRLAGRKDPPTIHPRSQADLYVSGRNH